MSSLYRNSFAAIALLALVCGCDRDKQEPRGNPLGETIPIAASPDTIFPGGKTPPPLDPRAAAYAGNAYAIAQGQQLFTWMNCTGCHSHGGGGIGPALMDGKWRYGGRIDQIAASIANGRPNGMPSWRGKLTNQQIWQLAAYVRTLSGQVRKDAVGARADTMGNSPPQTETVRKPVTQADSAQ
jgi:cytochrome c oxidase cbb3-type subunit 3